MNISRVTPSFKGNYCVQLNNDKYAEKANSDINKQIGYLSVLPETNSLGNNIRAIDPYSYQAGNKIYITTNDPQFSRRDQSLLVNLPIGSVGHNNIKTAIQQHAEKQCMIYA